MRANANEISKKALNYLFNDKTDGVRFGEMARVLEIDDRSLSKNLFWLEEHGLVKLSTSLSVGSTFPKIVLVKLTKDGKHLVTDSSKLDQRFPSGMPAKTGTYRDSLIMLRREIREDKNIDPQDAENALESIETLLALDLTDRVIG